MKSKQSYMMPVIAAALGFFMALLDTTIVNVSLPKMTTYYETTIDQISWVIDSYNIAFGVVLLTAVRFADQFGRKKIFQIGLMLFVIASVVCGLSQSIELLILFRSIQGLAAAMIVPVCIPLVLVHTPAEKVGVVTALFGIMAGVSTALGPTIGGVISENFSWKWIFYINVPIGLLAVSLIHYFVHESYDPTASKKIDWMGMITISISLFALIYGLLQVKEVGWTSPLVLCCLIGSVLGLLLFVKFEAKNKDPMLPVQLFKNYQFACGNIALLCLGIGMMCVYFLMAFYLITVNEISQIQAGLILSSSSIATMLITPLAAKANKWGTLWFGVSGYVLFSIGTYLLGFISSDQSVWVIVGVLMIVGLGSGLIFSPLSIALILQVPEEKAGIASGLFQVSRVIGAAVGVAILVVMLQHMMQNEMKAAKNEMIEMVEISKFSDNTKERLKLQFEQSRNELAENKSSLQDVIHKLTDEEEKVLKSSPNKAHAEIKGRFAVERKEIINLYPTLEKIMKDHISLAYKAVFRFGAIVMLIGAVFAYLNGINARRMKKYLRERNFEAAKKC